MATYAFDFINEAGTIGSVALGEFPTEADAVRGARHALAISFTAVALDVWSEGVHVMRLRRGVEDGEALIQQGDASAPWNVVAPDASENKTA